MKTSVAIIESCQTCSIFFCIACRIIATDGVLMSLPDSSIKTLHMIPGARPLSNTSFPFIQIEGVPLIPRLIASS